MAGTSAHEQFIGRVYRRLILVRAGENLAQAILCGCALAVPMIAIAMIRHQPVWTLLAIIGTIVFIAAAIMTISRWPTFKMAATEADRQLNLHDLLSTALEIPRHKQIAPDLFSAQVTALADARCRSLSPSAVILNRLGARTWGGVGLSLAFVLTLAAVVPLQPMRSDAANDFTGTASSPRNVELNQTNDLAQSSPTHQDPAGTDQNRITESTSIATENSTAMKHDGIHSAQQSSGTGNQQTTNESRYIPPPPTSDSAANISGPNIGEISGGQGSSTQIGQHGTASGIVANHSNSVSQPNIDNSALEKSGNIPVSSDKVPDQYRDLVREYFQNP